MNGVIGSRVIPFQHRTLENVQFACQFVVRVFAVVRRALCSTIQLITKPARAELSLEHPSMPVCFGPRACAALPHLSGRPAESHDVSPPPDFRFRLDELVRRVKGDNF